MDDFRMEVDERGNINVMSYVDAIVISKEEQEQVLRIFNQLQEENDKLRELARVMHGELVSCEDNGYVCGGHKFDKRCEELGVDVIK